MSDQMVQIPFNVNRNDTRTLVQQVADGLRQSIASGRYRPNDALPSSRELAALLGVSRIVTSAALERLVAEGWAMARPRLGCVVRDRSEKAWRGHLLVVCPEGDDNFFQNILIGVLRRRLGDVGYLVTAATVPMDADGRHDFSHLDVALSVSVDLALVVFARQDIFRHLARRNVPFCVFGELTETPKGAVGIVSYDYSKAVPDFVAACVRAGVRRVEQVGWHPLMCDAVPALQAAGIDARRVRLRPDLSAGRIVGVRKAGMDFFAERARRGRLERGTLYFFNDDNLTSGALAACAFAGLRVPNDVCIATWANRELGPVYPVPFARMEMDEVASGETVSEAVIAYLDKGTFPEGRVVGADWIDGATLSTDDFGVTHT